MTGRMLVVDDDRDMVRTLCDVLRLRGWQVQGVHSGEEALDLVDRQPFGVVLMDIKMPGIEGTEACRVMVQRHPGLRVILMTAHVPIDAIHEAERDGAWRVMRKPVEIGELLALLGG